MWNARQLEFINQPLVSGRLLGVPGGGKTRCLLGRVLRLIDDGIIDKRGFLMIAFSKLAVADFLRKGRAMRDSVFDETNVRTIHSLSGLIVNQLIDRKGWSSVNTVVNRARVEVERAGENELRRQVWCLRGVAAVFVDEAQDMSPVQYDFAVTLAAKLRAPLCLVGDPNQSIYQFQGGTDRFLRDHPGFSVSLTHNYRSTAAICKVVDACKPVEGDAIVSAAADGSSGPAPEFFCEHQRVVAADVADKAAAALAAGRTVAVIGPIRRSSERHGHYLNLGLSMMAAELAKRGVPFAIHYREDSDSEGEVDGERGGDPSASGVVHLLTAHGSKGLEFDVVLLINYHMRSMGIVPPAAERGALHCLWYVGLSRARQEMTVYCDKGQAVWPGYLKVARHMRRSRLEPRYHTGPITEPPPRLAHGWTDLLKDPLLMDERRLTDLEESTGAAAERRDGDSDGTTMDIDGFDPMAELPDEAQLSALYGVWAENTHAHHYRGDAPPVLLRIEAMLDALVVPPEMNGMVRSLWGSLGLKPGAPLRWSVLDTHRQSLRGTTVAPLVDHLDANRPDPPTPEFLNVRCVSDLRWWDVDGVRLLVAAARDEMRGCRITLRTMWRLCLLEWQHECECGYRWAMDDEPVLAALKHHHTRIAVAAAGEDDGLRLQVPLALPHLPVTGVADGVDEKRRRVVELKFVRSVTTSHALQAIGYTEMVGGRDPHLWTTEIHNLRTNERFIVRNKLSDRTERWKTACVVSDAIGRPLTDTSWLYDLETTGLDTAACGLLEVHLEEYTSGLVPVSTLVRQESVPDKVTEITGISAADTEGAPSESLVASDFRRALQRCDRPRLLAHNGHRFDHVIMQRHDAIPDGTRLVDTMHLFPLAAMPRRMRGERKGLSRIYETVLGRTFAGDAHRASADVRMMRDVLDAAGLRDREEAMI